MKKIKHKKLFAISLISCAAVATAGIGYASWVISASASQSLNSIAVTADEVTDNRITLGIPNVTDGTVRFGPTKDTEGSITSEENAQNMEFVFTIPVTVPSGITGSVTLAPASNANWPDWSDDYIVAPFKANTSEPRIIANFADGTVTGVSSTGLLTSYADGTLTVTVTFAWGEFFGSHNPATPENYFGGGTGKTLDQVVDALEVVSGYDTSLSLVVSASASSN